jgi:hypothetical protein
MERQAAKARLGTNRAGRADLDPMEYRGAEAPFHIPKIPSGEETYANPAAISSRTVTFQIDGNREVFIGVRGDVKRTNLA